MIAEVDVIVTTYNRSEMLRRALDGLLGQTYPHVRVIVVDDASTDNTIDVIAGYGDALEHIRQPINRGVSAARNVGLEAVHGDFFGFLDDDDEYLPTKVAEQVAALRDAPKSVVGVECSTLEVAAGVEERLPPSLGGIGYQGLLRFEENAALTATFLFRTEAVGDLRCDETLPAYVDYDFVLQALQRGDISTIDNPLVRLHHHDGPRVTNVDRHIAAVKSLYAKRQEEIEGDSVASLRWHFKLGRLYLKADDGNAASRHFGLAAQSASANFGHRLLGRAGPSTVGLAWRMYRAAARARRMVG